MPSESDEHQIEATMQVDTPPAQTFASGRYVVRRILPEGGQKSVYLVRDTLLERDCALAVIKAKVVEEDDLERLKREAQSLARLPTHPNLVTVYDLGSEGDAPYLVSEYVPGGDLRRELREAAGPLAIDRAVAIAIDVAQALSAAHGQGIIHRDLKPANIWLTEKRSAKLGDFGLAIAMGGSRLTSAGTLLGTAAYVAPEQALGGVVDARSDLYALGIVLYEMVCGRPPFEGGDVLAVISQHVHTTPVEPSWHNAEVPRQLESLVMRLLAKAPEDRHQTAEDVADALRRLRRAAPDEAVEPPAEEAAVDLRGLTWGRFVGRQEELRLLRSALDGARSGRGSLVMLVGEPGIGKTRLAQEFAVFASVRGAEVIEGRAHEGEGTLPYGPFIEAFRQHLRERPADVARQEIGSGAPQLAAILHEVRDLFPDLPEPSALEGDAERQRLFESVLQFVRNAASAQPLVILVDDLHWADRPSLLLLRYLARNIATERVLIVGAYRDVEVDRAHPLAETLAVMRREQPFERLTLRGLPEEEVRAWLAAFGEATDQVARDALAIALFRETEGNPFFIREVLSHLVEEGKIYRKEGRWTSDITTLDELAIPEGVREVLGRRLSRLSDGCANVLTRASAMTGGFSWEALCAISGSDEAALLDLLDEALSAQLVHERKEDRTVTYDFTHALIRHTLYDGLSAPRRRLLHRQIGDALEDLYGARVDARLGELAYHYFEAAQAGGAIEKAVDYATRAAERAREQYGYEESAIQYERALVAMDLQAAPDDGRRCELLLALGRAAWNAGEFTRSRETYRRAAELAESSGSAEQLARAALGEGGSEGFGFRVGALDELQVRWLERALAALGDEESSLRARVMASLSSELIYSEGDEERKQALARGAVELARNSGDRTAFASVLISALSALSMPDNLEERLGFISEAIALGAELKRPDVTLYSRILAGLARLELGEVQEVRREYDELMPVALELRRTYEQWVLGACQATFALMEGRLADAELAAREAVAKGQGEQNLNALGVFGSQMFAVRREQGRLEEMIAPLSNFIQQNPAIVAWRCGLAVVYSDIGRESDARALFEEFIDESLSGLPRNFNWLTCLTLLSDVCWRVGDSVRARRLYDFLLPFAKRNIMLTPLGPSVGSASHHLGMLAATMARWSDAKDHFEEALRMNARNGAPPLVARTQHAYAAMLLARASAGDRDRASALLAEARATATDLDMPGLLPRIEDLQTAVSGS